MTNPAQEHISQLTNHKRIRYLDISNRDLAGETDLKEFTYNNNNNKNDDKNQSLQKEFKKEIAKK